MQLTGGQALARQLVLEGITDLFGVPGVQLDWAVDGLREVSSRIRYVVTRHDPTAIEKAAALMATSRFPVIYAGGGVLAAGATAALQALAEQLSVPVVLSENGRGAMSDRHPLTLNSLGGRAVFAHADVVLVVGSRFADTMFGVPSWQAPGIKYVWLNVDPVAWKPPRNSEVGIAGDARLRLEALAAALPRRQPDRDVDIDKVRNSASDSARPAEPQISYIRA